MSQSSSSNSASTTSASTTSVSTGTAQALFSLTAPIVVALTMTAMALETKSAH